MTIDEKEIKRKRRILNHADESGNIAKTCRYFGIPRSLFYVWRNAYRQHGDEGLRRKALLVANGSSLCKQCTQTAYISTVQMDTGHSFPELKALAGEELT